MKINDIKVGSRFRKDLGDLQTLANTIQEVGALLQPVVVNENNELVAGQRRIEACKLLGWTEISAVVVNIDDIIKGEFYENAVRKDFTPSERVAILEEIETRRIGHRLAKNNGNGNGNGKGVSLTPFQNEHKGEKSREIVARYTGIKPVQLQMEKKVVQTARKDPSNWGQLLEKVDNGKVKLHKAYHKILREERKLNALNAKPVMKLPHNVMLLQGDCRDKEVIKNISDNSIPLIFTDLPYDEKSLPLYGDLFIIADRVLMPGGALVTYASHPWLPRIFKYFEENSSNLRYLHEIAVIHAVIPGGKQKAREWSSHTEVGWKPLLLFVKGKELRTVEFFPDIIFSPKKPDKDLDPWQQSPIEAKKVIRWLTFNSPNEIVLDPFMGSGTTGIVARKLGRSFIGIDIDPEKVRIAERDIANFASYKDVDGDADGDVDASPVYEPLPF